MSVSEKMESMGYCRKDVEESLMENKYNDVMATYLLLSRKVTEVRQTRLFLYLDCVLTGFLQPSVLHC